jgi:hypothetical protein
MIRHPTVLLLLLAAGCGTSWAPIDADGDGYARQDGDCWDAIEGPRGSGLAGTDIHPDASEAFYDGIDQDCDGQDDFDQDGDGWVSDEHGGATTLGVPDSGQLSVGDCWDEPTGPVDGGPTGADIHPAASETFYDGVDQDCDGLSDYDADLDGHDSDEHDGDDCDDGDDAVNPDATEVWYDGTDQDCDGNDCDQDGDGYGADGSSLGVCEVEDCDDSDPAIYPDASAVEVWYNGVDENCDDNDGDQDDDGYWAVDYADRVAAAGGEPLEIPTGFEGDCDDEADSVHPNATETWYDGTDQDCDGLSDYDADYDTYDSDAHGGTDCDDDDASVNPLAIETWYDGVDQDCDGLSDYDVDGDGYDSVDYAGDDCDDGDATINPGVAELWYDGTDQNCDGQSDYDADYDGHDALAYGGDDCNDSDLFISPDAPETWYDGTDQDCDGLSDYDADYDGFDASEYGGDDCDDLRSDVNPDAAEAWDRADNDCDGLVDDMVVDLAALGWLDGSSAGVYLGHQGSLSSGDVDGDGVTELLVGSTEDQGQQGTVWVVDAGAPSTLRGAAAGYANPTVEGSDSAGLMAIMGPIQADLTGDGVVDLLVGGTDYTDGDNAAAALYQGGSSMIGVLTPASALLELTGAASAEPPTVLSHLDLDGDGVAELLWADWDKLDSWSYYNSPVYLVETAGLTGSMDLSSAATEYLFSWTADEQLGRTMGGGDLDGDGYDDLILAAPGYSGSAANGYVGVFTGANPLPSWSWYDYSYQADLSIEGAAGGSLGEAGMPQVCDLDADGTMDLVLSDPSSATVYVFLAAASKFGGSHTVTEADLSLSGDSGSLFGHSLQAGDFTGDGVDDLYVGAPGSDDPGSPSAGWDGALYLFDGLTVSSLGAASTSDASASLLPDQASLLGASLIGVDLDLDGVLDPIVAAPAHDDQGRVWLVPSP